VRLKCAGIKQGPRSKRDPHTAIGSKRQLNKTILQMFFFIKKKKMNNFMNCTYDS